jgi:hypothetical protein
VCHGDVHPGNTLWFGVTLGAVIDFDSARYESLAAEVANAMLQFSLKHRVGENPDAWQIGLDIDRLHAFSAGYRSVPATVPHAQLAPLLPWLMMSAVVAEAAGPIARDGDFAGIPAVPFLRATSRCVDWISDRTRAISSTLGRGGTRITPSDGDHGGIVRDSSACSMVRATRLTCAAFSSGYAPGPPARWHERQHRSTMGAMSRVKSVVADAAGAIRLASSAGTAVRVMDPPRVMDAPRVTDPPRVTDTRPNSKAAPQGRRPPRDRRGRDRPRRPRCPTQ